MLYRLIVGAAAAAALLPIHAFAQSGSETVIFGKGHYKGVKRTLTGPTQFFEPFVMRSVRLPAGKAWEFCSGNSFTGCRQINQSTPAMIMNVRSARPSAAIISAPTQVRLGQSLRGLASEFFTAPDQGGQRLEVEGGTGEAASRRAQEFCRSRGWRTSAHERLQTVGGRVYLADVLCSDSGN